MIKPMFDRLLVKRSKPETKTAGGLYIPDTSAEKKGSGTIIAIGTGKRTMEGQILDPVFNVGDKVLYAVYAAIEHDEDHVFLREDDIFAIEE